MTDSNLFSPIVSELQDNVSPRREIFLTDHLEERRFCAWAVRDDPQRGPTKVPFQNSYIGHDGVAVEDKARSNDPYTWLNFKTALIVGSHLKGGVGLFLGKRDIVPGYRFGGVDLDSCVDSLGTLTPWAEIAIDHLNSYTEMSPSGTGYKILFLYRTEDIPQIKAMMGFGVETGKQYKTSGGVHPPGLEFYISGRFFAFTGKHYPTSPRSVCEITLDDFRWLIQDLGPQISSRSLVEKVIRIQSAKQSASEDGGNDHSRSGAAYRRAQQLRQVEGLTDYEDIKNALLNDANQDIQDWMREKGLPNHEREYNRIFFNSTPNTQNQRLRCRYAQMQRAARLAGDGDPFAGIKLFTRGKNS